MKRILIITSEFPPGPGGIGQHSFCLATELVRKGYWVYVATNADNARYDDVLVFDDARPKGLIIYRTLRNGAKTYLHRIHTVLSLLRQERIDKVILSGKFSLWIGLILKILRYRIPTLAILHGSEVNIGNGVARWITHKSIGSADSLISVSNYTKSLLPAKILDRQKVTVIPNGVDLKEFKVVNAKKMYLRGNPVLLTVGNVTRRKGQHRVISVLPEILKAFPEACYHIIGLPTLKEDFERVASDLKVENHVVFHGRLPSRNDLGKAYRSADAFILLSENQPDGDVEGFGIVILEANLFGLPTIGALGCGISDAIQDGVNGYLVDGESSFEVLEALKRIMANRGVLSVSSKVWADSHDWTRVVEMYRDVLEQVV